MPGTLSPIIEKQSQVAVGGILHNLSNSTVGDAIEMESNTCRITRTQSADTLERLRARSQSAGFLNEL